MSRTIRTKDRSNLEEDINSCWDITSELKMIYERLSDGIVGYPSLSEDNLANILLGLVVIYEIKFQRLHDTFKQVLELDSYKPDQEDDSDV